MNRIKWITQAFAQRAGVQKGLFPDFVNVADELAVEWEVALDEANENSELSELTEQQRQAIKALDDYMLSISGLDNIQYWDDDALYNSDEWRNMRELAKSILNVMGWDFDVPGEIDSIYIKNS